MNVKQVQERMVADLKEWQEIEDATITTTGQIMAKTQNPVVRLMMEIILRDSQSHRRVQKLVIDSLEGGVITLTPDELGDIFEAIDKHNETEKRTVELASELLGLIQGRSMLVEQYALQYLLEDERKHVALLDRLDAIKAGMYISP